MSFDLKILEGEDIPVDLLEIPQPPKKLYLCGNLPREDLICLAVVGSRKCTTYGKDTVKKLISGLKGYPIAIVSGLAVGIDSFAHETALDAGLFSLAFPGSGISEKSLYPISNLFLAEKIITAGGCVISEFPPEMKAELYTFPMRNRLMAGISKAALIIEAQEKSGTLITARMALDYNKEVLAVPGPINSEYSKGIFSKKRKMQKITFLFNSYSGFEAHSIIDTIVNDLNKSGIQMLSVRSSKNVKQIYSQGFVNPNDNIQPSVRVSNPIGFRR